MRETGACSCVFVRLSPQNLLNPYMQTAVPQERVSFRLLSGKINVYKARRTSQYRHTLLSVRIPILHYPYINHTLHSIGRPTFRFVTRLDVHMNDITQEMHLIFSCLHCSNSFSVQQGLNDACLLFRPICLLMYQRTKLLQGHMETHSHINCFINIVIIIIIISYFLAANFF